MIIDANLLIYAVDATSPHHRTSRSWLDQRLNGSARVGLPWTSLGAFLRITSHPRIISEPLSAEEAWDRVEVWLSAEAAWVPPATERTAGILGRLMTAHGITGNLVPDAMLAALAIEHGLEVATADTDFARFRDVRWVNPLTDRRG